MQFNVPHGKKHRGLLTVGAYKNLVHEQHQTKENIKLAQILGWCTEMVNGFLLLYDDIMDGSSTRRGQSCWYKLEDVGMIAINDTIIIENAIYILLRKHFRDKECYASIMELFHEVIYATACGQCMDFLSCQKSVLSFTEEQFKTIAINKSAHYTFYLPIMLAMELAGVKDPLTVCQLKNISNEFGILFQIQNDFLDWYVNPEITGKIGSDIEDNNCSWFAVECLKRANEKQKQIMAECYGKKDPQKVLRVKQLFIALELDKAYTEYEQQAYKRIKTMIEESSDYQPKEAILHILDKSYLRKR
uniref:Farnesyl pyrophosphate synthase n=1 Tax=Stomoxys calcitrans TaxID=35570 RepID=A0A1I8P9H1_STOCA